MLQTILDTLGDFDFALTRQQLDCSHFAHVHAHRIGSATEVGIHCRQRLFSGFFGIFIGGDRRRISGDELRLGIRRLVIDLDRHIVEGGSDGLDLLGIHHVVWQMIVDLGVGKVTPFLAQLDEVFQS